jgi:hypothetical protein
MVERSDTIGYGVPNEPHPERVQAKNFPVYLLIRCAIFRIAWHPYQGVRGFGFGFRGIAALNQRLKAGIPSGFGSNRRNQKGQLKNRR